MTATGRNLLIELFIENGKSLVKVKKKIKINFKKTFLKV